MSFERRKVKIGRVVSDKMDRTVVVHVEWRTRHRLYKKTMRRKARLKVHDPLNLSGLGDLVQVIESRPRSKTKKWRLEKILQKSDLVDLRPEEVGVSELAELDQSSTEVVQSEVLPSPDLDVDLSTSISDEPVAQEETEDEPVAQEETEDEPVAQEETEDEPVAQEETEDEPVAQEETEDEPVAQEETEDEPVAQEETEDEPVAQEETEDEPVAQEETEDEPVAQENKAGTEKETEGS